MAKRPLSASRLLIVYNADGGLLNMLKDAIWKLVRPSTYPCSLCAITYGPVSMRSEWRRFLKGLKLDVVFHHKDDFAQVYPDHGIALPAIAITGSDGELNVLVSAQELDALADTTGLIDRLKQALIAEHARRPSLVTVA